LFPLPKKEFSKGNDSQALRGHCKSNEKMVSRNVSESFMNTGKYVSIANGTTLKEMLYKNKFTYFCAI
jgi:hypothetical protein